MERVPPHTQESMDTNAADSQTPSLHLHLHLHPPSLPVSIVITTQINILPFIIFLSPLVPALQHLHQYWVFLILSPKVLLTVFPLK